MAFPTGHENHLNRLTKSKFGSDDYAREELIAELTAALVSMRYGITKNLSEDSVAYLKSWLKEMHESPQYLKSVLMDVKKASAMITTRLEETETPKECAQEIVLAS